MTINLSDNSPRISYTVSQGATQTSFAVPFEFFDNTDLNVFVDGTKKSITTHYTVSGGNGSTGTVTISVTGISGGSTVIITRDIPLSRTTDFPTSGPFDVASLNTELDRFTAQIADQKDQNDRSIRLTDDDEAVSMTLPLKSSRAGKVLGFNSSSGSPEVTQQVTGAAVNVSGLSTGASPTASVNVADGTATFAFGIPAGATGSTGNTGSQGPQGPAGAAGDNTISVKDEGSALSTAASTLNFVGSGVTASGTGAEKTVTITDTDTTYSVGDGGLTQNNFTNTLKSKLDGVSASANNYSLPTASSSTLGGIKIGSGLSIDGSGVVTSSGGGSGEANQNAFSNVAVSGQSTVAADAATDTLNLAAGSNVTITTTAGTDTVTIASTDTNTTYSVGDGGLTQNNFTNTLKTKLDGLNSAAYATSAQGTKADAALPKAGGTLSGDIDGNGNKVLFANVYSALSDLPSASTYHGMFAHVHAEGKAYYAHAGAWVPLANASQLASVGDGGLTQNNFTNALKSKLDGVAASANNYVHPNHSGEVTSTADGATVIADNIVDEANLKVSNTPTNGYFLSAQSGASGGLTWAAASGGGGIANVVEDTSPQLGADLDVNAKAINFGDSNGTTTNMLTFGAGGDLKIYHHATAGTYITEAGTGNLNLLAGDLRLMNGQGATTLRSQNTGIQISNSYILPTADGSNGQVMTTNGSGVVSFADAGGGGADLYAANESSPSAQPSATGTNGVAIGDSAVSSGYQAIALGNANASGEQSCAIGIRNNTTSYGSVGSYSFAQGRQAKAQGSYSVSLGRDSHATGTSSSAIGYQAKAYGNYAIGMGYDSKASKTHSVALGSSTNANAIGKFAFGSGSSNTYGYAQSGMIVVAGRTANANAGVLVSDNATQSMGTADDDNQLYLEPFGAIAFDGLIVARGQGSASDTNSAAWKVEGLIRRENAASTTTLVNSAITVISNVPNWGLSLSADTSNGCLSVNVTGASSSNVKWVCTLRSSETIYNSY